MNAIQKIRQSLRSLVDQLVEALRMLHQDPAWYEEIEDEYNIF